MHRFSRPSHAIASSALRGAASAVAAILLVACIDRSNPFDPVNQRAPGIAGIRASGKASLDSMARVGSTLSARLSGYRGELSRDSARNAALLAANDSARRENKARSLQNAAADAHNRANPSPDSLRDQVPYRLLETLPAFGPYGDLDAERARAQKASSDAALLMADANARNAPLEVYPRPFRDSVLAPLDSTARGFEAFLAALAGANAAVADSNAAIAGYNAGRAVLNDSVAAFNRLVAFLRSTVGNPPIGNPDTLKAATQNAKPGDTLVLGRGTLEVDLRFRSGTPDSPIVIRGMPGGQSVLRAIPVAEGLPSNVGILQGSDDIRFEDIVFRGGTVSGVKLESGASRIAFRRCVFDSNGVWGLEVIDSDVTLIDCEVRDNRGGGIRFSTSATAGVSLVVQNALIVRNGGNAIELVAAQGRITHSTIADNDGAGVHVTSPDRSLTISNSIIGRNRGFGIHRQAAPLDQDRFTVEQSDVWGNLAGDWDLPGMDPALAADLKARNLDVDPGFVDPPAHDYRIRPGSALEAYERLPLPVVIGWRPRP